MSKEATEKAPRKVVGPMKVFLCEESGDTLTIRKTFSKIPSATELKAAIKELAGDKSELELTLLTGRARPVTYKKVTAEKFDL